MKVKLVRQQGGKDEPIGEWIELSADNDWKHKFSNLPTTTPNGQEPGKPGRSLARTGVEVSAILITAIAALALGALLLRRSRQS